MYKCRPWRWLWGLVPLALLCLLAFYVARQAIEQDLTTRAQAALSEAGLFWAVPSFNGRDAVINGTALSEAERTRAHQIVGKIHGVRVVEDRAGLIPIVSPFTWAARHKEDKIRLKGHIPSEKDRGTILGIAKANFPGLTIDDKMKVARGAPSREAWLGGVAFGLKQLSHMKRGIVQLKDTNVSISGDPKDMQNYQLLQTAVKEVLPVGLILESVNITLPIIEPYVWSANLKGGKLTLQGYVPSRKVRGILQKIAQKNLPSTPFVDETVLAGGSPKDWEYVADTLFTALSKLKYGELKFNNTLATITGTAGDKEIADKILAAVSRKFPSGFKVKYKIDFLAPPKPIIPNISPYSFSAESSDGLINLTGFVPSKHAETEVRAIIQEVLPELRIIDEMSIGLGGPGETVWLEAIRFGLTQLKNLKFGTLKIIDGNISISGEAASAPGFTSVYSAVKNPPQGFNIDVGHVLAPHAAPFLWTAKYSGKQITFIGNVPDEETRGLLLSLAEKAFSGMEVVDQMTIASGAPDNWLAAVRLALQQLARMERGSVTLDDTVFTLSGAIAQQEEADAIQTEINAKVPYGYSSSANIEVTAPAPQPVPEPSPPASPEPEANSTPQPSQETGTEPSPSSETTPDEAAMPEPKPEAEPEPDPEPELEQTAAQDTTLVTGAVSKPEAVKEVTVDECQKLFASNLASGSIQFKKASAVLTSENMPLFDKLASTAKRCSKAKIKISGHTDSDGPPAFNLNLSKRRASAVVDYLVKAGLARSQLTAVGYGESKPIVKNNTEANKAKNRRIEFKVEG